MHANHREEVDEITAGNLGALVGLKNTTTGDTLCDENNPIILEKIIFRSRLFPLKLSQKQKLTRKKLVLLLEDFQKKILLSV